MGHKCDLYQYISVLSQPEFQTVFPYTYFMMNLKQTESFGGSISLHTAHIIPRGWYLCFSE